MDWDYYKEPDRPSATPGVSDKWVVSGPDDPRRQRVLEDTAMQYLDVSPTVADVRTAVERAVDNVPNEFRSGAVVQFYTDYDGNVEGLRLAWSRPETDDELLHRISGGRLGNVPKR